MLDTIKALVKAPRIAQLHKEYESLLDESYVAYDSWIRQKEVEDQDL